MDELRTFDGCIIRAAEEGEGVTERPGLIFTGKVVNLQTGESLPLYKASNPDGLLPSINTLIGWTLLARHPEVYKAKKLPDADSEQGKALALEFPELYANNGKEANQ